MLVRREQIGVGLSRSVLVRVYQCWSEQLHVVGAGVEEVGVHLSLCGVKAAVVLGLAAVVAAQGRAPGVALPDMEEVLVGAAGREAAVFTNEDLGAALAVGVLLVHAVDLPHVRLQGAALSEGLLTQLALVGTDTCVCPHVALQVEGVVEALPAEATGVPLHQAVALQVAGQHSLQGEHFVTHLAHELSSAGGAAGPRLGSGDQGHGCGVVVAVAQHERWPVLRWFGP